MEYELGYYDEGDVPKYVIRKAKSNIKKIEKVFEDFSIPLYCVGVFSNGEAVYKKVKKNKKNK